MFNPKKFGSLAAATALMLSMVVTPVFAANYTAIPGGTTNLEKVLIVKNDAEIPAATFEFSVSAGSAVAETANTVKVYAGVTPEKVKVNGGEGSGTVAFTAGEAKTAGAAEDGYANDANKSYAKKTIGLDFSGVSFTEPGVYRYLITEADPASPISAVGEKVTTVDVYVEDNDGKLEVKKYVAYDGTITSGPASDGTNAGTKDDKFKNELSTQNIEFGKEVTGNQGSKDQYFEFKLTITGAGAGTVLTVEPGTDDIKAPHANNATSFDVDAMTTANTRDDDTAKTGQQLVANDSGEIEWTLYLHDGQYVKVTGLPAGATYTLTETDATGYTKAAGIDKDVSKKDIDYKDPTNGSIARADIHTGYTNNREGVIPTGIAVTAGAGIGICALGIAGIMLTKKRKKYAED